MQHMITLRMITFPRAVKFSFFLGDEGTPWRMRDCPRILPGPMPARTLSMNPSFLLLPLPLIPGALDPGFTIRCPSALFCSLCPRSLRHPQNGGEALPTDKPSPSQPLVQPLQSWETPTWTLPATLPTSTPRQLTST